MEFKYFSRNGKILPKEEATIPLSNIEYSYGFGVYETIRVSGGKARFLKDHMERLQASAEAIGLAHAFTPAFVAKSVEELIAKNAADESNLKILLIGGRAAEDAQLDMMLLNPLFPDKKLYRDGATCISVEYERAFPHAKTLNMLRSYLAYRKAREEDAYDALLVDRQGRITEGTRTNFFCIKDTTLYSPRESDILLGVTRKHVLDVASKTGLSIEERDIRRKDVASYDACFITSTSTKIMPVRMIDDTKYPVDAPALRELMTAFDAFITIETSAR
jgi:branched-chain amino acid aminotransferase